MFNRPQSPLCPWVLYPRVQLTVDWRFGGEEGNSRKFQKAALNLPQVAVYITFPLCLVPRVIRRPVMHRRVRTVYIQILCCFIGETWTSLDLGTWGGPGTSALQILRATVVTWWEGETQGGLVAPGLGAGLVVMPFAEAQKVSVQDWGWV